MIKTILTGLVTAAGMIWLLLTLASGLVDWIVQLAAVPADWTGLMTLAAWVLVLFFGGGISIGMTVLVTMIVTSVVGAVFSGK